MKSLVASVPAASVAVAWFRSSSAIARHIRVAATCAAIGLLLAGPASRVRGQEDLNERSRKAIASNGSLPWYDPAADELRPMSLKTSPEGAEHRDSDWVYKEWDWDWPQFDLSGLGDVLRFLVYAVLILVAAALLALLIRWLYRLRLGDDAPEGELEELDPRGDVDRVEALPFPVMRQRGDLLDAARQAYDQGRFDDAIVFLFSYLLVRLDRAQRLRLTRGKTNRQYLREVGWRSPAGSILEPTMLAFEDVYFGRHPLTRERFESCWNRLAEFHALVGGTGK